MKIGFVGLGKLGFPVALAIASKGHKVVGYDRFPHAYLHGSRYPQIEEGLDPLVDDFIHGNSLLSVTSDLEDLIDSDLIFLAVQTPHHEEYGGSVPAPEERKDFDYTALRSAVRSLVVQARGRPFNLVVISTCLPGTFQREIAGLVPRNCTYMYNPLFIAMGTVLRDYFHPEFVLVGGDDNSLLEEFYSTIHDSPVLSTTIVTAEAIKVSYNTFITTKLVLANTWMQIAEKVGANVDDIHRAWLMANDRLVSEKYLSPGMSDGGGCHPRDNIALSWLGEELGMEVNYFENLIRARESHEKWIAGIVESVSVLFPNQPARVLGVTFKPNVRLTDGSPSRLLCWYLEERGLDYEVHDPHVGVLQPWANTDVPGLYVVATAHDDFRTYRFPVGSVVIDPTGIVEDQEGVVVRRLGRM